MGDGNPTESDAAFREATERHKYYLEERRSLNEAEIASSKHFDEFLIGLSSGALALSVLYLEKVSTSPAAGSAGWLVAAWVSFAATLLIMLVSFLASQNAWRRQRDILDREHRDWCAGLPERAERNGWSVWTQRMNVTSLVLFGLGVVAFVGFALLNVPRAEKTIMNRPETKPARPSEERGSPARPSAVPPPSYPRPAAPAPAAPKPPSK